MDQPLKPPTQVGLNKVWKLQELIDITVFKPHSTRGAATSAAKADSVPVQKITSGWLSEATFSKFYDRPIRSDNNFAEAVLSSISL